MINYDYIYPQLLQYPALIPWAHSLPVQIEKAFYHSNNGNIPRWLEVFDQLSNVKPSGFNLNASSIEIGAQSDISIDEKQKMEQLLHHFQPWRKGPFTLFDIFIDTEWRSDLKWERIKDKIQPLKDRLVLDIGCGNGYHCFRMAGMEAKLTLGIDFTALNVIQFLIMQKYLQHPSLAVLPIGIDDMPMDLACFDTVFSMGVIYHRRSPLDHLLQLKSFLRPDGEVVIDTLVIDGKVGQVLTPEKRYAQMPNVWFIPSCGTLELWMRRMGFEDIRCIDVSTTTNEEQRATEWMGFHSLSDFLDPHDPHLTVEGYPAPKRAVFIATNPAR